jgi:hypothetical protein
MNVDLGFKRDHLLTFSLPVPPAPPGSRPDQHVLSAAHREGRSRARCPVGLGLDGDAGSGTNFGMPFELAGKPSPTGPARPGAGFNMVSPEYFRTFGITMDRGRPFNEQDRAGGLPVAVVNAAFAKKFLADVNPLEQRIVVEQLIPGVTRLGRRSNGRSSASIASPERRTPGTGSRRSTSFRAKPLAGASRGPHDGQPRQCPTPSPRWFTPSMPTFPWRT